MNHYKRIIIKLGTSTLTGGSPQLDRPKMLDIVRGCAALHQQGVEIILVSSGAVAVGKHRLGFPDLPATMRASNYLLRWGRAV